MKTWIQRRMTIKENVIVLIILPSMVNTDELCDDENEPKKRRVDHRVRHQRPDPRTGHQRPDPRTGHQ